MFTWNLVSFTDLSSHSDSIYIKLKHSAPTIKKTVPKMPPYFCFDFEWETPSGRNYSQGYFLTVVYFSVLLIRNVWDKRGKPAPTSINYMTLSKGGSAHQFVSSEKSTYWAITWYTDSRQCTVKCMGTVTPLSKTWFPARTKKWLVDRHPLKTVCQPVGCHAFTILVLRLPLSMAEERNRKNKWC